MANKFPERGDFDIPSELIDEHEWMADELIDNPSISSLCTLVYPPTQTVCPNCYFDPTTGRSSGVYKSGGPKEFQDFSICPWCGGEGKGSLPNTANIRMRVYWRPQDWINIGANIQVPASTVQVIGYMSDLPELEKALTIIVNADVSWIRQWECQRMGEAVPHGFRKNRYFIQFLERVGGG